MISAHKHSIHRSSLYGSRKILHERWSSPLMFVLAAGGAAIGFNNFWQFPGLMLQHGGGAFLIVYLLCVLAIGLPLLMAEVALGRSGRASPVKTFRFLARRARAHPLWRFVGGMGIVGVFLILSYLSVIAGWVIAYTLRAGFGVFSGLTADGLNAQFAQMVKDPEKQLFWHTLFMVMTMYVASRGVRHGLESLVRYVMPMMLLLLAALTIYAATLEDFTSAINELFQPDFSKLSGTGILAAMSQAFFSLGLGTGAMLMYGAYLTVESKLPRLSLIVIGIDTFFAVVLALVIVTVLLAGNVALSTGPNLVFQSLPLAFDHVPNGRVFLTAFLALLVLAAWTSSIWLAEPVMVWLSERFSLSLQRSAILCGVSAWALGVITILSFNNWAFSFSYLGVVKKLGFFDVLQVMTAQLLLPLFGIMATIFAGWIMRPDITRDALHLRPSWLFPTWLWWMRLAVPLMLLIVLFNLSDFLA